MNVVPARSRLSIASRVPCVLRKTLIPSIQHVRRYTPPAIAGVSEEEITRARQYCAEQLRKYDTPSHLLLPFHPNPLSYLSIRTLNLETARIPDATTNPTVASMRIAFWRDAITSALALAPNKEPVSVMLAAAQAQLLAATDGKAKLSKSWLHRVVNEREKHLHNPPHPDLKSLETYAENTYSSLLYLTLQSLPMASITVDHLASHIGKAQGIVAVLRGLPLLAFPPPPHGHAPQGQFAGSLGGASQRQGTVTLPLDVMARHNVREHQVLKEGINAPGLRDAVFEVATRASDHLITAREMLRNLRSGQDAGHEFEHADDNEHGTQGEAEGGKGVDGQLRDVERAFGVLMPAVAAQEWLDRLQKVDFDVFQPGLRGSGWRLPLKLYWNYTRRQL